jgi:hypothetical protein
MHKLIYPALSERLQHRERYAVSRTDVVICFSPAHSTRDARTTAAIAGLF